MNYKEKNWFNLVDDGNYEQIQKYIDDGFDVNIKDNERYSETALIKAAYNDLDLVKLLLENGADIHAKNESGKTALIEASRRGHFEIVKLLLENGADINAKNEYGKTALIEASDGGHFEIVKLLLENGADFNDRDNEGKTSLFEAAEGGHLEIVKLLIELGADINVRNSGYGKATALLAAIYSGKIEVVKLLIEHGADIHAKNESGKTALIEASYGGHLEIVKLLIELGADINAKDEYGGGVLIYAIYSNKGSEVVQLLIEQGVDVNEHNKDGETALLRAIEKSNDNIAKILIEQGADVNQKSNNKNKYPIKMAVINKNSMILKLLISYGAKFDEFLLSETINDYWSNFIIMGFYDGVYQCIKNGIDININISSAEYKIKKATAIMIAIIEGNSEIVELLLDNGAKVNKKFFIDRAKGDEEDWDYVADYEPITPLILVVEKGYYDICSLLINFGAKVNYGLGKFYTALVKAVQMNFPNIVSLLLENGADVNCTSIEEETNGYNSWGLPTTNKKIRKDWTLLSLAARDGYIDIVKILLDYGILEIEDKQDIGDALINAGRNNHFDIVKLLIEHGADVNYQKDIGSINVFHYVIAKGDLELAKILLDRGADINIQYESGYSDNKAEYSALTQYCEQPKLIKDSYISFSTKFLMDANTIKFLIDNGCKFDKKKEGIDILLTAAYFADIDIIDLMLDLEVSPKSIGKKKRTILHELTDGLSCIKFKLKEDVRFANRTLDYSNYYNYSDNDLTLFYKNSQFASIPYGISSISSYVDKFLELFNQVLEAEKEIYNKYFGLIRVFVEKGLDVNKVDSEGNTPLHYAVNFSHSEIVEYLIEKGAILNIKNKKGQSALDIAIECKASNNANLLVDKGCLKDASDKEINDILPALMNRRYEDLIIKILESPYETLDYNNILWYASFEGLFNVVKLAIERGADVNSKQYKNIEYESRSFLGTHRINFDGATALIMTVPFHNRLEIIQFLISVGADLNIADDNGNTALMRAAEYSKIDCVKILVEAGAEINLQNNRGYTALIIAAKEEKDVILMYLVEQGADVNMCNKEKLTTFYYVVNDWKNDLMKEFLTEHGATVEEYDADEDEDEDEDEDYEDDEEDDNDEEDDDDDEDEEEDDD